MKKLHSFRHCDHCANYGLIRVRYHSGELFDLAICDCAAGQFWLVNGEAFIRQRMGLAPTQQVAWREDFEGEDAPVQVPSDAFVAAGKTAKRAKL